MAASSGFSVQDVLSYVPLTEAVEVIKTGIPKVLPAPFWTVTQNVSGNKARLIEYQGMRQLSRIQPYGSPSRQVEQLPIGDKALILLTSREQLPFQQELFNILREWESYTPQQMFCIRQIAYQGEAMRQRFENLEIAAVSATLANAGVLWFDSQGNLLPNSAGATLVVTQGVPVGNTGTLTSVFGPGGHGGSWATAGTDIVGQVNAIKKSAIQQTGYRLKYAIYGQNIPTYFATNSTISKFWQFNLKYQNQYLESGVLPKEMQELEWIPSQEAFWVDPNGATQQIFDPNSVIFCPEINASTYTLYRGSELVPTVFGPVPDAMAGAKTLTEVFGRGRYAKLQDDPVKLIEIGFDTFLPRLKVPQAFFFLNTTA